MPQNVHVVRAGGGNGAADEKAVEAVMKYRFKPATRDGQPVATQLNLQVNFESFGSNGAVGQAGRYQYLMPRIVEKVGGSVSAPEVIYKVDPEFTAQARKWPRASGHRAGGHDCGRARLAGKRSRLARVWDQRAG